MYSPNKSSFRQKSAGFTLLEVMIALAIFALMSVVAYEGLNQVMSARTTLQSTASQWRDLDMFWTRLQNDVQHFSRRPVRNTAGIAQAALIGNQVLIGQDDAHLWLTRNQLNARGELGEPFRLGYRLQDGQLQLLVWDVLDAAPRSRPKVYPLFNRVESFKLRYFDRTGSWVNKWQPSSVQDPPPRAIKVELKLQDMGVVERILELPE